MSEQITLAPCPEHDLRAVLRAVKDDPQACHSIAVWERVDAALADPPDAWIEGFTAAARLFAGDRAGYEMARNRYLNEREAPPPR